jgi:hypothetical protein
MSNLSITTPPRRFNRWWQLNTPLNRLQLLLWYAGMFAAVIAFYVLIGFAHGVAGASIAPEAFDVYGPFVKVVWFVIAIRLLYLRALDVGYPSPVATTFFAVFPLTWVVQAPFLLLRRTGAKLQPTRIPL